MKKTLVFAALASVALVGCTKNVEVANNDLKQITFEAPILSPVTKAVREIQGPIYPTSESFSVFAWYTAGDFVASEASLYMDNVMVSYNSSNFDTTDGTGAWVPEKAYYWPKVGKLTFDAYSPSGVSHVSCSAAAGLKVENFTAKVDSTIQKDLLYSTRVKDKTTSVEYVGTYDGVQIPFNHALSVVQVKIAAKDAAAKGAIKVKSIDFVDIYNEGTFNENLDVIDGTPGWTVNTEKEVTYSVIGNTSWDDSKTLETYSTEVGGNLIVLPQIFSENAKLVVKYYIENDYYDSVAPIEQTYSFALNTQTANPHKPGEGETHIGAWKMGNRYTYSITFSVDNIYFAPTVTDWVDYDVTVPTID